MPIWPPEQLRKPRLGAPLYPGARSWVYGAMDGASKFVRGDAIAGLIITGINIVGGLLAGMIQNNLSFSQAIDTYTILTVGDGLVSQMPALLISTAAGIVVTRTGDRTQLGKQMSGQVFGDYKHFYPPL